MIESPLIGPDALAAALAGRGADRRPALLDVRWDLQQGPRPDLYSEAHLPGAAFVDLDRSLAADPGDRRRGRHPLPDPGTFLAAMRAAGVSGAAPVVVYDDAGGTVAARAWWLLRHYGHPEVAVLDGGLTAWRAEGRAIEAGSAPDVAPGDFAGEPGHMPVLDADRAAALAAPGADGVLLDARAGERFRGEVEPMDPAAGHIPGAHSRPTADNLGSDRRFRDPARLARDFAAAGARPGVRVGAYCGSGVTAAHEVLALALAGIAAALYPGSWSEWSADPARPVATGAA